MVLLYKYVHTYLQAQYVFASLVCCWMCAGNLWSCVTSCWALQAYLAEKKRMEELEDEEMQLYASAKKKMAQLRKDKESEIFR